MAQSNMMEQVLAEMPKELYKFLDTLTGNELNELEKIDPRLIAKVYQAGAIFSIEVLPKITPGTTK